MGIQSHLEHRLEQRLKRIEEQLHDLLVLLESASPEQGDQIALREMFRELEAEQQDQELLLLEQPAANDPSWV